MTYTAQQLITKSWYLSGIVSPQAQGVQGFQITQGLDLLNELLDFKQVQTSLIPYFKYNETYSTVAGQEKYFIENCSIIQSMTFNFGTVRFPLTNQTANQYLAGARVNQIISLPYSFMQQRVDGGTDIRIYFIPQQAFQLNIYGKFYIQDVSLNTDLTTDFDLAYIEYLRFVLAEYMAIFYNKQLPPMVERKLAEITKTISQLSPPDATVNKISLLQGHYALGWGFINRYDGWMP